MSGNVCGGALGPDCALCHVDSEPVRNKYESIVVSNQFPKVERMRRVQKPLCPVGDFIQHVTRPRTTAEPFLLALVQQRRGFLVNFGTSNNLCCWCDFHKLLLNSTFSCNCPEIISSPPLSRHGCTHSERSPLKDGHFRKITSFFFFFVSVCTFCNAVFWAVHIIALPTVSQLRPSSHPSGQPTPRL